MSDLSSSIFFFFFAFMCVFFHLPILTIREMKKKSAIGEVGGGSSVGIARLLVKKSCDRVRQKSWSPRSVSCVAACKILRSQSWDPTAI